MLPSLEAIAQKLGGEVSGGEVRAPGPGHSAGDRSMVVKVINAATDDFIVNCFSAKDDAIQAKDYVRGKLGLPPFKPTEKNRKGNGGADRPYVRRETVGRWVYRQAGGAPYLRVERAEPAGGARKEKVFFQSHWIGEMFASGAPKGPRIPYRLPELIAAPATTPVYIVEGEGKCDLLRDKGFTVTTAPGGSKAPWEPAMTTYFKDRHVIILPDADKPGRLHAAKVARALDGTVASLKVVELYPDRHDEKHGLDIADWLKDDPACVRLNRLVNETPIWEPQTGAVADDALIAELAGSSALEYAKRRKEAAERIGITVTALDAIIKKARGDAEEAAPAPVLYAHWNVEPAAEPVDGSEMMAALVETIRRFVFLGREQVIAVALWIIFTWVHDLMTHSPMLFVTSAEMDSGKSTLLGVVEYLVRRGVSSVEASGPALFRSIKKWSPCFIIDEADDAFKDSPDLRSVVNSGWTRGSGVIRCHSETLDPELFSTFTAKAIGMKGRDLPGTTLSRSIIITMRPRRSDDPAEHVEDFDHLDNETFAQLRSQIMRWATDHGPTLAGAKPETPPAFANRRRANWKCLLGIAERIGGDWKDAAWKAALAVEAIRDTFDPSIGVELLVAIRDQFAIEDADRIASKALQKALVDDETGPWASFGRGGKPISENGIARLLKPYEIKPRTVRLGSVTAKGYLLMQFSDAFDRHITPFSGSSPFQTVTPSQVSKTSGLGEKQTVTTDPDVTDEISRNPLENKNCDGVTDENAPEAEKGRVRCAQCGGEPDGTERFCAVGGETVWLHPQCERAYLKRRAAP